MNKKILLLEDDPILAETLLDLLEARGFDVTHVEDGLKALDATYDGHFDLMILDVNVPKLDGFDFLSEMRQSGESTPALFITARTDIASVARGFEVGADDYIKKPFDFEELTIRIDALLRKAYRTRQERIPLGELHFAVATEELYHDGESLPLPPADRRLLARLVRERDRIVPKEELLAILGDGEEGSEGALRVHISRLRKLGLPIETRKGIGYRLAAT
jgi:DNA-binding response OmpR family regulator